MENYIITTADTHRMECFQSYTTPILTVWSQAALGSIHNRPYSPSKCSDQHLHECCSLVLQTKNSIPQTLYNNKEREPQIRELAKPKGKLPFVISLKILAKRNRNLLPHFSHNKGDNNLDFTI